MRLNPPRVKVMSSVKGEQVLVDVPVATVDPVPGPSAGNLYVLAAGTASVGSAYSNPVFKLDGKT